MKMAMVIAALLFGVTTAAAQSGTGSSASGQNTKTQKSANKKSKPKPQPTKAGTPGNINPTGEDRNTRPGY